MDQPVHSMSSLFAQLGLPAEAEAIRSFIEFHRPLPEGIAVYDAPFWTAAQATFLREEMQGDADWTMVIDRLSAGLRVQRRIVR